MFHISLIVAVADNGVIGRDNDLPWRLSADLKHFKRLTMGKPMIMGRRTFESIGKPLPGRRSIVLTRDAEWQHAGVDVYRNLDDAIGACVASAVDECMVIGGASVYASALPHAARLYLTQVHADIDGDTFFPAIAVSDWRETERETVAPSDDTPFAYSFVTLERAMR
ncbi:MAG: dihydrofolate reductase [Pseudomonadota bacterium]